MTDIQEGDKVRFVGRDERFFNHLDNGEVATVNQVDKKQGIIRIGEN